MEVRGFLMSAYKTETGTHKVHALVISDDEAKARERFREFFGREPHEWLEVYEQPVHFVITADDK